MKKITFITIIFISLIFYHKDVYSSQSANYAELKKSHRVALKNYRKKKRSQVLKITRDALSKKPWLKIHLNNQGLKLVYIQVLTDY